MADDRSSYKGQNITLELHTDDRSGGVPSAPDEVIIFQDKEVCYSTTSIVTLPGGGWSISLNTDQIKYTGDYIDRWNLSGSGDGWVEKSLSVTEAVSNEPRVSTLSPVHFSKDLFWDVQPDGDLYRIYDNNSIAAKIEAVVMTIRGSLYNEPGHGTDLYRYLFSMSPTVAKEIRLELETQIQLQVPQIKVSSIDVEAVDHNTYNVVVKFYTISSSNPNELLSMTNLVTIEGVVG